ncbi:MAG TPA: hypothetical protein VG101_02140 [Puia sp.]|jgi:heme/copper-type cytochrome/quinol oxidase subunit 1|nr:hypothetical protein [Puia sp.]
MKKVWAILIWGVLVFAIGTYLDKVRELLMSGNDLVQTYVVRFGIGFVLVIVVVLVGKGLRKWVGRNNGLEPGDWFMIGAVAWVIEGGYGWLMDPRQTVDIRLYDTMFVIARLQAIGAVVILYALIGVIYYQWPRMNKSLGFIHFFVTQAALYVMLWMRYFNPAYEVRGYLEWHEFQKYQFVSGGYEVMALLVVVAQVLFVLNLFLMLISRVRRVRRRSANGRFRG